MTTSLAVFTPLTPDPFSSRAATLAAAAELKPITSRDRAIRKMDGRMLSAGGAARSLSAIEGWGGGGVASLVCGFLPSSEDSGVTSRPFSRAACRSSRFSPQPQHQGTLASMFLGAHAPKTARRIDATGGSQVDHKSTGQNRSQEAASRAAMNPIINAILARNFPEDVRVLN